MRNEKSREIMAALIHCKFYCPYRMTYSRLKWINLGSEVKIEPSDRLDGDSNSNVVTTRVI